MSERRAKCLETYVKQIDAKWPGRDKSSDGWIAGEQHHQQNPTSDHEADANGVVHAQDITNDPEHGLSSRKLAEGLVAAKDNRIKYLISDEQICSGTGQDHTAWVWRPYDGTNDHREHMHLSVKSDPAVCDNPAPWDLSMVEAPDMFAPVAAKMPVLKRGDTGRAVKALQSMLTLIIDGIFGQQTEAAVVKFQIVSQLVADGIVGPATWAKLVVPDHKPPAGRQVGIMASMFGGVADNENSAYTGKLLNDSDLYVSLPFAIEYPRRVRLFRGNVVAEASVEDKGPWCTTDNYVANNARPLAETCYNQKVPLPEGSGPNAGKVPANPAGIDLSPALDKFLGTQGMGLVDWEFVPVVA